MSSVPYKSQRYGSLKNENLKRGELFIDDEFPAHNKSVFFSKIDQDIVWKRPNVSVANGFVQCMCCPVYPNVI